MVPSERDLRRLLYHVHLPCPLIFIQSVYFDVMVPLEGRLYEVSPDAVRMISLSPSSSTMLTGWQFLAIQKGLL